MLYERLEILQHGKLSGLAKYIMITTCERGRLEVRFTWVTEAKLPHASAHGGS